jgi:hypothetical protein
MAVCLAGIFEGLCPTLYHRAGPGGRARTGYALRRGQRVRRNRDRIVSKDRRYET